MIRLTPPLAVIESNLFGDAPTDTPEPASAAEDWNSDPPEAEIELPPHLAEMIRARAQVAAGDQSLEPAPGKLLRIDRLFGPDGPCAPQLGQPLAVLLSGPGRHPSLWSGWLASWETDYATDADLLLESGDRPYDPLATMIQLWNPVEVYLPCASAVLGQLGPERLAAVRERAADLAAGVAETDVQEAAPGTLRQAVTSGGRLILTGSPLGDAQDPRQGYRQLYGAVAERLHALAREVAVGSRADWISGVLDAFRAAGRRWSLDLTPVVQPALGDASTQRTSADTYRLGDLLDIRFVPAEDGEAVQMHVQLRSQTPLIVAIERAGKVRQSRRLDASSPAADFFAGGGRSLSLTLRDAARNLLLEVPFPDGRA
ncbi:hypothetical protein ThidrDRAFT_4474 [Thiorhodococcus drewsii AZ1]|uniref:Uncharacterized protein n=1 Tax=Thiorhodococcus drewsii AZ1 TaxID=765913 RepID=G2E860_9GAMM|nr:hypothetical protein [Thiorhodococcus drewsii]EGV27712.1 hypothetical protein ThidrDRAFT_4474 [Thiorhodococcus drewsii AZ1]